MLVTAVVGLAGIVIGYALGSPRTVERTVERHIDAERVDVKGSVHSRGEATAHIEAENVEMDVTGSVHGDGRVRAQEK